MDRLNRQHEVLHQVGLVALEARSRRCSRGQCPVLHFDPRLDLAAAALSAFGRPLRLGRRLHAARLDLKAALQALQPCVLFSELRNRLSQLRNLAHEPDYRDTGSLNRRLLPLRTGKIVQPADPGCGVAFATHRCADPMPIRSSLTVPTRRARGFAPIADSPASRLKRNNDGPRRVYPLLGHEPWRIGERAPNGVSECVHIGGKAKHVNISAGKVELKRWRSGDSRIVWGKHLQNATLGESVFIRPTMIPYTHTGSALPESMGIASVSRIGPPFPIRRA